MPIDYTALPIQPPAPLGPDATDEQRAAWLDQHRICASYANSEAQMASAEEMRRGAAAQERIAESVEKDGLEHSNCTSLWEFPSDAQMFFMLAPLVPMRARDTELSWTRDVLELVKKVREIVGPLHAEPV